MPGYTKRRKTYRKIRKSIKRKRGKRYGRSKNKGKTIQQSSYIPKTKLLRFDDVRSYTCTDDATITLDGALHPVVMSRTLSANDPTQAYPGGSSYVQGDWSNNAMGTEYASVQGLAKWLAYENGAPKPDNLGQYCSASVVGCDVTVTATPIVNGGDFGSQLFTRVFLQCKTRQDRVDFAGWARPLTEYDNADMTAKEIMTVEGCTKTNPNGDPKGCTLNYSYKFKNLNTTKDMTSNNFTLNTSPLEKDWFNLVFMPQDTKAYASGAVVEDFVRCPSHYVTIKMSYVIKLSELRTGTIFDSLTGQLESYINRDGTAMAHDV